MTVFRYLAIASACASFVSPLIAADGPRVSDGVNEYVLTAGHPSLKVWLLSDEIPAPDDNRMTPERVELGKKLFFDPRLSATNQVTCASCHFPERGWTDGLPTAVRFMGGRMDRATPSIVNLAYNSIYMWDGRQPSMEAQATGGQGLGADINGGAKDFGITNDAVHIERLSKVTEYVAYFNKAYPGEGLNKKTVGKALASFQRSVVSRTSPFDQWVRGDSTAMSPAQINGFRLFLDPAKGNCVACHSGPNFTDNGFHNVGLKSFGAETPDPGRYKIKALALMKGAFKTPTLRDVALTAPYFHDGSALLLRDVVAHYVRGGDVKTNLSPNLKPLTLSNEEQRDLVDFMQALTSPQEPFEYPRLPRQ